MRLFKFAICPKCWGSGMGTATADGYQCHRCYRKGFIKIEEPGYSYWFREKLPSWINWVWVVTAVAITIMGNTAAPCVMPLIFFAVLYVLGLTITWSEKGTAKSLVDFAYEKKAVDETQKEQLLELANQDAKKVISMFSNF